jgi:hypothetical protein
MEVSRETLGPRWLGAGEHQLPQAWTDRGQPPLVHRLSAEGLAALATTERET